MWGSWKKPGGKKDEIKITLEMFTPLYTDSTDLAISAGGRSCKGRIDEVRIYNRALSADEIKKIYTDEKAMFK